MENKKETSLNEESSKEKEPSSTHEKERKRTEKEKKGIREPVPLKDRIKRKRRHKPIWNVYPTVSLNDPMTNSHRKFPTNQINTTKYNIWTFLPKNLFEQFRRATNFYFLIVTIITLIPQVSPLTPITSILPLSFVLGVTAIKEAYEDYKRYVADKKVNNALYSVIAQDGTKLPTPSKDIKVGDLIYIEKDQVVPADIVLLTTGLDEGVCYVDTAQLDGETTLKLYRTIPQTYKYLDKELLKLKGEIECEIPHHLLDTFNGKLIIGDKTYSLDSRQLLLRGARIRNTPYIFGIVVYAGVDTKLSLNQKEPPSKFSRMDKMMNRIVIGIFLFQFVLTIIASVLSGIYQNLYVAKASSYLGPIAQCNNNSCNAAVVAIINFFGYFVILSFLIPMSMMVTLEVIKVVQTLWMEWDEKMRSDPLDKDTGMNAKTSNLNDELALVKYIFSDKTGTLTENKMEFAKCSIYGIKHENEQELVSKDEQDRKGIIEFLKVLALCQSGVPEEGEDGSIKFQSQSPDEIALLKYAQANGFIFLERKSDELVINEKGTKITYKILNILEFSSKRARMSVILRTPEGKIMMYAKGADSVMFPRLVKNETLETKTRQHINDFSTEGLRTLIVGKKELKEDEYNQWHEIFHDANTSITDRVAKVEKASELIEKDFELIGCTAIEDKLQEGVPETIHYLLQAGIKIWIITGDKQETAINIGKSTNLLKHGLEIEIINADSSELCEKLLNEAINRHFDGDKKKGGEVGLVIDGKTLVFALTEWRTELLKLSSLCDSVVCCRVTPLQKAQIVRLIKQSSSEVCLSVGDGANDVSMIQEAHIGIGIYGKEGTQAARASDYAIQQFQHLRRLLCVHGRYSMVRNALCIHFSLYKNMAFFLVQFWYSFFCLFSAQTIYDAYIVSSFNIIFTSLPPFAVGFFEKDIREPIIAKFPQSYQFVQNYNAYNYKTVFAWLLSAFYHSLVFITFSVLIFWGESDDITGQWMLACIIATSGVMVILSKIALHTTYWNWVNHLIIWLSVASFFLFYIILSNLISIYPTAYHVIYHLFETPRYYLAFFLTYTWALFPDFAFLALKRFFKPQSYQILQQLFNGTSLLEEDEIQILKSAAPSSSTSVEVELNEEN